MKKFFKIGQEVYCLKYGEGVVIDVESKRYEGSFPIEVRFEKGNTSTYTNDGRITLSENVLQSLYQNKPIFTENVEIEEDFEHGEMVWAKSLFSEFWHVRYYAKFENGSHFIFNLQTKLKDSSKWEFVRKFEDNPLLDRK